MNKVRCDICEQEFSVKGIHTHKLRKHGSSEDKLKFNKISNTQRSPVKEQQFKERIEKYNAHPKKCKYCELELTYDNRYNTYCSKSCAAKFNNAHRPESARKTGPAKGYVPRTIDAETGKIRYVVKVSATTATIEAKRENRPHSMLYRSTCKHCGTTWLNRTAVQYCVDHADLYSTEGASRYYFTFKLSDYPDLFDFSLLKEHGIRSRKNPNGVTRDHRVSIHESIKNNHDPYYIKHPMNCELMLFKDNAKKGKKSSIGYRDLVKLVDAYDKEKRDIE